MVTTEGRLSDNKWNSESYFWRPKSCLYDTAWACKLYDVWGRIQSHMYNFAAWQQYWAWVNYNGTYCTRSLNVLLLVDWPSKILNKVSRTTQLFSPMLTSKWMFISFTLPCYMFDCSSNNVVLARAGFRQRYILSGFSYTGNINKPCFCCCHVQYGQRWMHFVGFADVVRQRWILSYHFYFA